MDWIQALALDEVRGLAGMTDKSEFAWLIDRFLFMAPHVFITPHIQGSSD